MALAISGSGASVVIGQSYIRRYNKCNCVALFWRDDGKISLGVGFDDTGYEKKERGHEEDHF